MERLNKNKSKYKYYGMWIDYKYLQHNFSCEFAIMLLQGPVSNQTDIVKSVYKKTAGL